MRIAIVVSRFNQILTEALLEGAEQTLIHEGVAAEAVDVVWVPGAFEIPLASMQLAASGRYQAVVCLGAVVRGETPHFDYICAEVASGLTQVALTTGVPATFGVITADTMAQGLDRAGGEVGNKGIEAALAALEMANLKRAIQEAS